MRDANEERSEPYKSTVSEHRSEQQSRWPYFDDLSRSFWTAAVTMGSISS